MQIWNPQHLSTCSVPQHLFGTSAPSRHLLSTSAPFWCWNLVESYESDSQSPTLFSIINTTIGFKHTHDVKKTQFLIRMSIKYISEYWIEQQKTISNQKSIVFFLSQYLLIDHARDFYLLSTTSVVFACAKVYWWTNMNTEIFVPMLSIYFITHSITIQRKGNLLNPV